MSDKPSTPGEGVIELKIRLACVEAGYSELRTNNVLAAVRDHARSCAVAERRRLLASLRAQIEQIPEAIVGGSVWIERDKALALVERGGAGPHPFTTCQDCRATRGWYGPCEQCGADPAPTPGALADISNQAFNDFCAENGVDTSTATHRARALHRLRMMGPLALSPKQVQEVLDDADRRDAEEACPVGYPKPHDCTNSGCHEAAADVRGDQDAAAPEETT